MVPANIENGSLDQFDTVRAINTFSIVIQYSSEFLTTVNSDTQAEATGGTGLGTILRELDAECNGSARKRGAA